MSVELNADSPEGKLPLVLYDGECGLCHGFVRVLLAVDRAAKFHFAPLSSRVAREHLQGVEDVPDSIALILEGSKPLFRSVAVLSVLRELGGPWRLIAFVLRLIPVSLSDAVYDLVARYRKKVFGERTEACPLVPAELKERFLLEE